MQFKSNQLANTNCAPRSELLTDVRTSICIRFYLLRRGLQSTGQNTQLSLRNICTIMSKDGTSVTNTKNHKTNLPRHFIFVTFPLMGTKSYRRLRTWLKPHTAPSPSSDRKQYYSFQSMQKCAAESITELLQPVVLHSVEQMT